MIVSLVWGLVVLVAIAGGFITKWVKLSFEHDRAKQAGDPNQMTAILDSMRRLEERVGNLERAVTTAESERKYAL